MIDKVTVDIERVKTDCGRIGELEKTIKKISDSVLNTAKSAPSYNGQFGPVVQGLAIDANSVASDVITFLAADRTFASSKMEAFKDADTCHNILSAILEFIAKISKSKLVALPVKAIDCISAIIAYFTNSGGERGLIALADLFDGSVDLYVGLWKSLKKFADLKIDSFTSPDGVQDWKAYFDYIGDSNYEDFFSDEIEKKLSGLEIVSSVVILIASIDNAIDTIRTEDLGSVGQIGEILMALKEVTGIITGVRDHSLIGTGSEITLSEKLGWNGFNGWVKFSEVVLATAAQVFLSIEKYSADGKWDWGDTAETFIDASISGLSCFPLIGIIFSSVDPEEVKENLAKRAREIVEVLMIYEGIWSLWTEGNFLQQVSAFAWGAGYSRYYGVQGIRRNRTLKEQKELYDSIDKGEVSINLEPGLPASVQLRKNLESLQSGN